MSGMRPSAARIPIPQISRATTKQGVATERNPESKRWVNGPFCIRRRSQERPGHPLKVETEVQVPLGLRRSGSRSGSNEPLRPRIGLAAYTHLSRVIAFPVGPADGVGNRPRSSRHDSFILGSLVASFVSDGCMTRPCSSLCLSRSRALATSLRIPDEISGAISLSNPPGLGAMTRFTLVPAPSSDRSHQPAGPSSRDPPSQEDHARRAWNAARTPSA